MQGLEPLQQAQMQVASHPWPIDSLAICQLIARDVAASSSGSGGPSAGAQLMDYTTLLSGLTERSPFRALAAHMGGPPPPAADAE